MIHIHFYCQGYENSKGLAIIQDFTAHWAIKNEEIVNVWTFNIESESSQFEWRMFPNDLKLNWIRSAHISPKKMIEIYFYFQRYKSYKRLAIIYDLTAHWMIENKHMVNVWK
jgi:hypothetical protein